MPEATALLPGVRLTFTSAAPQGLGHHLESQCRLSLATNAERVCAEIRLRSGR
jgi:hypothetical protein